MNKLLEFLSENQQCVQSKRLPDETLRQVCSWYEKWTGSNNMDNAFAFLSWLYVHEDIDMDASLFQNGAEYAESNYGVCKKDFLDCTIEARKIIFG